jgi:SAM-dependent methyltransferase
VAASENLRRAPERAADVWASAEAYEPYVGRWSRLVAREFVGWLALPPGLHWLDVGCGTGAVSEAILDRCAPAALLGVDPSEAYVAHARARLGDQRARFEVGDARRLPVPDGSFDAVVSGLVLNFVPEPERFVAEMCRAARYPGSVAVYVWDYADRMELMRHFWDAAVELDPAAVELDEGRRFPLCHPSRLRAVFAEAGVRDVQLRAIDVPTVFRDFADFWTPFLGGQAPAPGYCMSLSEERRAALRDLVRSRLPIGADGTIRLIARAWAVRGLVP